MASARQTGLERDGPLPCFPRDLLTPDCMRNTDRWTADRSPEISTTILRNCSSTGPLRLRSDHATVRFPTVSDSFGSANPSRTATHREIHFPPYRLDIDAGHLCSGDRAISLRPKTWGVLCYLAERPGILVTKEELLDAVWSGISVTEATLTKSIGEIRDALHDDVRHPRFVETVYRRGFRFVPRLEETLRRESRAETSPTAAPGRLIGREAALGRLHSLFERAGGGTRQVAFVTGEAGIGKTSLVETFLASLAGRPDTCVAAGQCVRLHGGSEPLMPVLEALGRLARGRQAARVVQLLRDRAPGWLIQLPWLVDPGTLDEVRTRLAGTSPERMLRVFAELIEELTSDTTLVLVLEDLHWADPGTVDIVSVLAERTERARLLVLGTYRPAEAIVQSGPFDKVRRVLAVKRQSSEIALGMLSPAEVGAYLEMRFGGHPAPPGLAELLYRHTDGHPLFLVTAVNFLVGREWIEIGEAAATLRTELTIIDRDVPTSLEELVELEIRELDPLDVGLLEVGSVAGLEFGAQAVSAVLAIPLEQVEEACERLARSQRFLRASGTEAWPDGAVAARYAFAHALYQRVFYHRLPAGRRCAIHQKLGGRLEAGFGARAPEIAVELAGHFDRGAEHGRAIEWLATAAASAGHRFAPREAATYLRRALELLEKAEDGPERRRSELELTTALAAALIAADGMGAQGALDALMRARAVAAEAGTPTERFHIAYMLANSSGARADSLRRGALTDELTILAAAMGTPEAPLVASMIAASEAVFSGRHADGGGLAAMAAADAAAVAAVVPGENPVVWANGFEGWRLWAIGRPDSARAFARAAVACARSCPNPVDLAMALFLASHVHLWRGDLDDASAIVDEGRRVAAEHGFGLWLVGLRGIAGGVHLARGEAAMAVPELELALAEFRRLGMLVLTPTILAGLAGAWWRLGRLSDGLAALDEGIELGHTTFSRWYLPQLWTLRGQLLAAQGADSGAVESSFERAVEVARAQGALSFELRAATALAGWLLSRGRGSDARSMLRACHGQFREGADTADLRQAREMLASLDS